MGVYLGCIQITVPQQHLHYSQVSAMIQQMCGEGMPYGMGRQIFFDPRALGVDFNTIPERLASHLTAPFTGKHHIAGIALQKINPCTDQISL
jgi:hypothetical protein